MAVIAAIAAVGVGTQLWGAYNSYRGSKDQAKAEAERLKREGEFTKVESIFQALKIEEATRAQAGSVRAQLAGSGVVSGSESDIINNVNYKGKRDALWVLYTGELAEEGYLTRAAATQRLGGAQAQAQLMQSAGNALTNFAMIYDQFG